MADVDVTSPNDSPSWDLLAAQPSSPGGAACKPSDELPNDQAARYVSTPAGGIRLKTKM